MKHISVLLFVVTLFFIWCADANALVYITEEVARVHAEEAASGFTRLFFGITTTFALLMIAFGIFRKRVRFIWYSIGLLLFGAMIIINDFTKWVVFYEVHGVGYQDGAATAPLHVLLCLHVAAIIAGCGGSHLQSWWINHIERINRGEIDILPTTQDSKGTEAKDQ